jgi:hypothetical protein
MLFLLDMFIEICNKFCTYAGATYCQVNVLFCVD